jgi:hypothetical protein
MIYVLTVHWRSPQWIVPQLDYLRRYIRSPYRVFAVLNGIDDVELWRHFDYTDDVPGTHGAKLNMLARVVSGQADPDDIIIFLDSDAFPVRPLDDWLHRTLAAHPLVAIQRCENFGDLRPHPSFCATTVGLWNKINGDWDREAWTTPSGAVLVDAGTRVLRSLEEAQIPWLPLTRSNTYDAHPLWFGVYGHYLYHHGAGSRPKWSVLDDKKVFGGAAVSGPSLGSLAADAARNPRRVLAVRPRDVPVFVAASTKTASQLHRRWMMRSVDRQSERIFTRLTADPFFYREFDDLPVDPV